MHAVENTSPSNHKDPMSFVFVNSKEMVIYSLTVKEIAEAQTMDNMLNKLTLIEKYKP